MSFVLLLQGNNGTLLGLKRQNIPREQERTQTKADNFQAADFLFARAVVAAEAPTPKMSIYKFCPECNNILYPKENRKQRFLLYGCRNCDHQEIADNHRVYRHEVHHPAAEFTQVLQDVTADPTLPRTKSVRCAVCGHGEAVFLQVTSRDDGMTLFYVCCNPDCGHRWRD